MAKTLEQALEELRQNPERPVRATVAGMAIEFRATEARPRRSAAEAFADVGAWVGEGTDEIIALLAEARGQGARRPVPEL